MLTQGRTGLFRRVTQRVSHRNYGFCVAVPEVLAGVEDLPHLVEELVVLVLHLPAGGRVDPHCLIFADEVADARAVGLVGFQAMVGHDHAKRQE